MQKIEKGKRDLSVVYHTYHKMIPVIHVTPYDLKQLFIVVIPQKNNLHFIVSQPFCIKILANFIK